MERKFLQKIIKEFFTPFAKQRNFIFHKPTLMLRVYSDTVHIINFDLPSQGFNCNIAIQPLYVPSENIALCFGNRLNHFKTRIPGMWGYSSDEREVEKDLSQVKQLLETNAIPWFNEFGKPEGIISFIENGFAEDNNLIVGFPPAYRGMYLGYSYLYVNKLEFADKPLEEAIEIYKDDKRDWVVQQNKMINSIMLLAKNEPNKISEKLNEFVRITKDNLKIKM